MKAKNRNKSRKLEVCISTLIKDIFPTLEYSPEFNKFFLNRREHHRNSLKKKRPSKGPIGIEEANGFGKFNFNLSPRMMVQVQGSKWFIWRKLKLVRRFQGEIKH